MNISLYIARKLSLNITGKKHSPAINVAIIGVALSLTVMLLSVSIVIGFKENIRSKVIGFNSHILLKPICNDDCKDPVIHISEELKTLFDKTTFIRHWQGTTSLPAILKTDSQFKGIYLKGVDNNYDFSFLSDAIVDGEIPDFSSSDSQKKIIISKRIADKLQLKVGDKINIYFVDPGVRIRPMYVACVFDTHFEDYDDYFLFCSISMANEICGLDQNQVRNIEIKTTDFDRVQEFSDILNSKLYQMASRPNSQIPTIETETVLHFGASYFSWLSLLDTNVIVILTLMIIVSCFTLISCMLILILERVKTIGVLKAIGSSNRQIREIFIWMALKIAIIGISIGNLLAIIIIYLQQTWHVIPLDPESYYINYVPMEFSFSWIISVNIIAAVLIWLSLILPSQMVAKIRPASTLRTE